MNPFKSQQMSAPRNMLSGYAEPAHLNDFMFESQRRTFSTFGKLIYDLCGLNDAVNVLTLNVNDRFPSLSVGYALDPSVDTHQVTPTTNSYIGAVDEAEKNKGTSHFICKVFTCS